MKLRTRLALAFFLMSVLPLTAVTIYSYGTSQRAFRKAAMADFAPLGRTYPASLAGGIRRHVVMKHEAVRVFPLQRIDALLVARSAERGHHEGLRFPARKQCRAVGTREDAGAYRDRTHGASIASVNTGFAVQYLPAHDL